MKFKLNKVDQMKIILTVITIVILLSSSFAFVYYNDNVEKKWSLSSSFAFATVVNYQFYESNSRIKKLNQETEDLLSYYDALFDRYHDGSYKEKPINNLKTINDSYGLNQKVKVDFDLFNIIKISLEEGKNTHGSFNIAIGEMAKYYNEFINPTSYEILASFINRNDDLYCEDEICLPKEEKIQELKVCTPSVDELENILVLQQVNNEYYVTFKKYNNCETVSITLGAVAKGYALKAIGEYFAKKNVLVYLNAASSTYFSKSFAGQNKIEVKVVNPLNHEDKNDYAFTFTDVNYLASSTSGDYNQGYYALINNEYVRIHHIINPVTQKPENYYRSVSIYVTDPTIADILTTAFYNYPLEESYKLYLSYKAKYPEMQVVYITKDLKVYATSNLYNKITTNKKYVKINLDEVLKG